MKRSVLNLWLLLAVLLTACSKDDSGSESLIGDWDYIAYEVNGQRIEADACGKQGWFSIKENMLSSEMFSSSGSSCVGDYREATYTISGNKILAVSGTNTREIIYSISGDELTLKYNSDTNNPTIQIYKKRNGTGQTSASPLVGNWRLVALVQNGQVFDVTGNLPCFKNSTLKADAKNYTLSLSAPKQEGSTECNSASESGTWRYEGGNTYYFISNGGNETKLDLRFSDNNTTLQYTSTVGVNNQMIDFVFKKQ